MINKFPIKTRGQKFCQIPSIATPKMTSSSLAWPLGGNKLSTPDNLGDRKTFT